MIQRRHAVVVFLIWLMVLTFGAHAADGDAERVTLVVRAPIGHKFATTIDQKIEVIQQDGNADRASGGAVDRIRYRLSGDAQFLPLDRDGVVLVRIEGEVQMMQLELSLPAEVVGAVRVRFRAAYCEAINEQYCMLHYVDLAARELAGRGRVVVTLPSLSSN